jgi:hypothetical protein
VSKAPAIDLPAGGLPQDWLPHVELLWWEGCPSTEHAREQLREVLGELGLAQVEVQTVEVRSDAQARAPSFQGSPTILIDGDDVVKRSGAGAAAGESADPSLTCRVYRRRDGRISPLPDRDDVRDALLHAVQARARGASGSCT